MNATTPLIFFNICSPEGSLIGALFADWGGQPLPVRSVIALLVAAMEACG
jgi:hypothetical protein